ncbi:MAG: hypothetical protein ACJAUL_003646 [Paraglaciecola sp.]
MGFFIIVIVAAGGSIGFADPKSQFRFGYSMIKMGAGLLWHDRGQMLVDKAHKTWGCRTNEPEHLAK